MKALPSLLLFCILFSSCMLFKGRATAEDFRSFPATRISKSSTPFKFQTQMGRIKLPPHVTVDSKPIPFEEAVATNGTLALLILKSDTIVYEKYFSDRTPASMLTSFSVAKSFVSALIGIAIEEGHIESIHDKVIDYIPVLDPGEFKDLTIEHLLDMNSGIKFRENYVFGIQIGKYYYGKDIKKQIPKLRLKGTPGEYDGYKSINTQLLGLILEKATGQSLSSYMQEKLWQPLGANYDASWSIDSEKNKTEKSFCCINARARDFAKFGSMYANNGYWNGQQIVPKAWIDRSIFPLWEHWTDMGFAGFNGWYKNHWQNFMRMEHPVPEDLEALEESYKVSTINYNPITKEQTPTTYIARASNIHIAAVGHLGQYIYVIPDQQLVMVRFGTKEGDIWWPGLFEDIAALNQ